MKLTLPRASVAMTASPMLRRVVASHSWLTRRASACSRASVTS